MTCTALSAAPGKADDADKVSLFIANRLGSAADSSLGKFPAREACLFELGPLHVPGLVCVRSDCHFSASHRIPTNVWAQTGPDSPWRRSPPVPGSRTRARSPSPSNASSASRRGGSGCPQEWPKRPQVPPRNPTATPLSFCWTRRPVTECERDRPIAGRRSLVGFSGRANSAASRALIRKKSGFLEIAAGEFIRYVVNMRIRPLGTPACPDSS